MKEWGIRLVVAVIGAGAVLGAQIAAVERTGFKAQLSNGE